MKTTNINPNSVPKIVAVLLLMLPLGSPPLSWLLLVDVDGGDDDGEVGGSTLVLTMYHTPS